jgi:hypothetical protein
MFREARVSMGAQGYGKYLDVPWESGSEFISDRCGADAVRARGIQHTAPGYNVSCEAIPNRGFNMRPIKTLKRISLGLVLLIIIAGVVLYFTLNGIVRRTIATQATDSLSLQTDVGGVSLNLFTGAFGMSQLTIASPAGFQATHMLALGEGGVGVTYGRLRTRPIHIDALVLTRPQLVVEQSNGKFNFQTLMDLPPRPGEPMKVIIDKLVVNEATVTIRPGIPGLDASMKEIVVPIPTLELKNIGNADGHQNGAAMKEVAMVLITALADKAGQADKLPKQLQDALSHGVKGVENQLKDRLGKEFKGLDKTLKGTGLEGVGSDIGKSLGIGEKKDEGKK